MAYKLSNGKTGKLVRKGIPVTEHENESQT